MKKIVKIIILVLAVAGLGAMAYVQMTAPLSVELSGISPSSAIVTFTEQGSYDYDKLFEVYALVSGEIVETPVGVGDRVSKGDTLAVVSASDYDYQIAQLESSIKGYQSQIQNLQLQEQQEKDSLIGSRGSLEAQLVALEAQRTTFELSEENRHEQVTRQMSVVVANRRLVQDAKRQLDDAKDYGDDQAVNAAEQNYAAMRQALASSEVYEEQLRAATNSQEYFDAQKDGILAQINAIDARTGKSYTGAMVNYYNSMIESARSSIAQMSEKMGQATVTAPVDGIITELITDKINIASPQAAVAVIGSQPCIEVYVSTRELDNVKTGDKVELIFDKRAGEEILPGTVASIDTKAEARYSALGVEERKVRVVVRADNQSLILGGNMDVRFTVYRQDNCLIIPKTSVFDKDGQDNVWIEREGAAYIQPVEKGLETREGYVITSGLSEGDRIITDANITGLAEGKKIAEK